MKSFIAAASLLVHISPTGASLRLLIGIISWAMQISAEASSLSNLHPLVYDGFIMLQEIAVHLVESFWRVALSLVFVLWLLLRQIQTSHVVSVGIEAVGISGVWSIHWLLHAPLYHWHEVVLVLKLLAEFTELVVALHLLHLLLKHARRRNGRTRQISLGASDLIGGVLLVVQKSL